jgi:hypothetical protein
MVWKSHLKFKNQKKKLQIKWPQQNLKWSTIFEIYNLTDWNELLRILYWICITLKKLKVKNIKIRIDIFTNLNTSYKLIEFKLEEHSLIGNILQKNILNWIDNYQSKINLKLIFLKFIITWPFDYEQYTKNKFEFIIKKQLKDDTFTSIFEKLKNYIVTKLYNL